MNFDASTADRNDRHCMDRNYVFFFLTKCFVHSVWVILEIRVVNWITINLIQDSTQRLTRILIFWFQVKNSRFFLKLFFFQRSCLRQYFIFTNRSSLSRCSRYFCSCFRCSMGCSHNIWFSFTIHSLFGFKLVGTVQRTLIWNYVFMFCVFLSNYVWKGFNTKFISIIRFKSILKIDVT